MTTERERAGPLSQDVADYSLWSIPREAWFGKVVEQLEALTATTLGVEGVREVSSSTEDRLRSFETRMDENALRLRVD